MGFEKPNFNNEKISSEQEFLTPNFLQEQIRLPKSKWDEKFRRFINAKIEENQRAQESIQEGETESPEVLRERIFKSYLEGLGLSEEFLRGKKVLDLGCGEGDFVKFLIERGITSEAYGIDIMLDESKIEDHFKKHFFRGDFQEDLPVQNVDYIVSFGAVSNAVCCGEEIMNVKKIVEKSLQSLKEDGEIRIYPIQEAAKATPLAGLQASLKKWKKLLLEISKKENLKFKIEPRDIMVLGRKNSIILNSVLIIYRERG